MYIKCTLKSLDFPYYLPAIYCLLCAPLVSFLSIVLGFQNSHSDALDPIAQTYPMPPSFSWPAPRFICVIQGSLYSPALLFAVRGTSAMNSCHRTFKSIGVSAHSFAHRQHTPINFSMFQSKTIKDVFAPIQDFNMSVVTTLKLIEQQLLFC